MELAGDKAAGVFSLEDARNSYLTAMEKLDSLDLSLGQAKKRIDL